MKADRSRVDPYAPFRAKPLLVALPWVFGDGSDPQVRAGVDQTIDVVLWAATVNVITSDARDVSLFLVLKDLGEHDGAARRQKTLEGLVQRVQAADAQAVPTDLLARLHQGPKEDVETAVGEWRRVRVDRPRFVNGHSPGRVVDLYSFDGPHVRQAVSGVVTRHIGRAVEDFYLVRGNRGEVFKRIDDVVFGDGLANLGKDLTDRHRVLALRMVLADPHFPLVEDWQRRIFGDGSADGRPPGYVDDIDFLDIQAELAPVLAEVTALYASPIVWQPTEIWAYVLKLATAIRSDEVEAIEKRRDLGPRVAGLLRGYEGEALVVRREQVAAAFLALVARRVTSR